jgi:hypothetical protein
MSEAKKGKKRKPFTDETKNKMSKSFSGRFWVHNPQTKERKLIKENIPKGFVRGFRI